jgi:hypothetical protein
MDSKEIAIMQGPCQSYKALAAERWFGYGRWAAPYWFVGMEPGGEDDARVYETWNELGAPELLDLKAHSEKCEDMRWLVEHPPLQATWKQLIRMALGYEEAPSDTEDVRRYQRDRLGRSDADTLLIELSAVNAPSLSAHVAERESHRAERIATIRRRMEENRPKFVVFYGVGYRGEYEKVVGGPFDGDGYRWHGTTLCALVRHPAARSSSPASWWSAKGGEMRRMRLSNIG